jgi:hypothetical protein
MDIIKFSCNPAGTEKLPDDEARVSKHVAVVEWSNELSKSAFVGHLQI